MKIEPLILLLFFLSSAGYISFISLYGKVRLASTPFFYFSFVVIALYFFSLIGHLYSGAIFCLSVGLLLGAWVVYSKINRIQINQFEKKDVFWCILIATPFIVFYRAIPNSFIFTGWDEFSFWASSIKSIYEANSLYTTETPLAFKHYPPAQQLFQYYFTKLTFWSEGNVLYAQIAFVLAALMSAIGGATRDKSLLGAIGFCGSCAFLYYFKYDFKAIYSDQLLSAYFAACVILALVEKPDLAGTIKMALAVSVLVLLKQIGLVLAVVVLAIYAVRACFSFYDGYQSFVIKKKGITVTTIKELRFILPVVSVGVVLIVIIFAFNSWNWYVKHIDAWKAQTIPSIQVFFQEPMLQRLGLTTVEFINRIHRPGFLVIPLPKQLPLQLSIYDLTLGLAAISAVLAFFHPRGERARFFCAFLMLFFGALAYVAFHFLTYLVFFSEYEGVRLASFERYSAIYYLAWVLVLYAVACRFAERTSHKIYSVFFILVVAFLFWGVPRNFYKDIHSISPDESASIVRSKVHDLTFIIKKHIREGEKAYFISQDSIGFEKYIFNYLMLPYDSAWSCWSVGDKYREGDVWTCNQKLDDLLRDYDYLAIYAADEKFWAKNSHLFEPSVYGQVSGVFKIKKEGERAKFLLKIE